MKRLLVIPVLGLSVAISVPLAMAHREAVTSTAVSVSGKEFSFTLSRKAGRKGTFVFRFRNAGHLSHDFKIAGKKTPLVPAGGTAKLTVKFTKRGRYPYICTVPGHAAAGMKGVFIVK